MKTEKELKEEDWKKIEEVLKKKIDEASPEELAEAKGFLDGIQLRNAEVKQIIYEWYSDEKTCSGKPHCVIEDCDLCVVCFDELLQKLGLGK